MTEGSNKAREIDLGDDFGDVVVKANGAQVKINADGSLHGLAAAADDTAAMPKTTACWQMTARGHHG
jgi:serine phosphatase RsbU (regulator of sigma subunit)